MNFMFFQDVIFFNCRALVASVPFFTNAESAFVSDVVCKLAYEVFQPGMYDLLEQFWQLFLALGDIVIKGLVIFERNHFEKYMISNFQIYPLTLLKPFNLDTLNGMTRMVRREQLGTRCTSYKRGSWTSSWPVVRWRPLSVTDLTSGRSVFSPRRGEWPAWGQRPTATSTVSTKTTLMKFSRAIHSWRELWRVLPQKGWCRTFQNNEYQTVEITFTTGWISYGIISRP